MLKNIKINMNKFLPILLVGFAIIFSCKRKNSTTTETEQQISDSCLVIEKDKTAVFYIMDSLEIAEMQKKYGEGDTETILDDAMYYEFVADSILQTKGFSILHSNKKCVLFKVNNKEYSFNRNQNPDDLWKIIIINGKEPKAVSAIDIKEEVKK